MARITLFQGGIQQDAPSVTPFRAPDFGPGIGGGVEQLGKGISETAQKVDQLQDISARIEANRLSIAYNNLATTIHQRVHSTLGEDAPAAAGKGIADLQTGSEEILSKASKRARAMLEPQFAQHLNDSREQLWTYGFDQHKQAFDTSSAAANDKDLDTALKQSDDKSALPYLDSIKQRNSARAKFFGLGSDWEDQENSKATSGFYRGRALSIGTDSASGAIQYAISHRTDMSDDDFESVVKSYRGEALHETAVSMYYGTDGSAALDPTAPQPAMPGKTADPSMVFKGLIIPNEGTTLKVDNNGALVKYGINQKANPDVDVKSLTLPKAQQHFVDRYWNAVGADKMAPALAVAAADTAYVAGVGKAKELLAESGNDVQKFMELRDNFLASLHASNPAKYPDYTKRNQRVADYASSLGGDGTPLSFAGKVGPDTKMQPIIDEVMARKDMPLALKTELIDLARQDRSTQREDKEIAEKNARDTLYTAMTQLGDNFTSVKQLPPEALANADPETIHTLTDYAKTNGYKKADETLRPYVTTIEVTDPKRFLSADFITDLMKKHASPELINSVQSQQAEIAKKQMNAKPDVVSSGELWKIAEPAFKAAGIGVHAGTSQSVSTKKADAAQQDQALVFLNGLATEWAVENPGKKPTEQIMRQWIGASLLKTKSGSYLFSANDGDLYNSMGDQMRGAIVRQLRRNGDTAQGNDLVSHVAQAYRNIRALYPAQNNSITLGPDFQMRGMETATQELSDQ